ncbi:SRPBCC family protein [Nocardia arthritidis]|uniref:SRPBCC family protein n=1 Tax=Nocardia arthritidis TaxID=228602 RepID=UPI0007A3F817|nr:SRPBCC family protein [Nocardia arthritidis]
MNDSRAQLRTVDGAPTLRFERRLAHPPEKVWRAISDPGEMAAWFPAAVTAEPRPGAAMRFGFADAPETIESTSDGEVLEFDPPKVYMFRWNRDVLRFELVAEGDGTLLIFTHVLGGGPEARLGAARSAVGWDRCLSALTAALDGARTEPDTTWLADIEGYIADFGLDAGACEKVADRYVLRFARDLVWQPLDRLWSLLVEQETPSVGAHPPVRATNQHVEAGELLDIEPPRSMEYQWRHDGAVAGTVRWAFEADSDLGVRVVLTQTLPAKLAALRPELLAAWQVHLELFFAATQGDIRCPWPADRVAVLAERYAADLRE